MQSGWPPITAGQRPAGHTMVTSRAHREVEETKRSPSSGRLQGDARHANVGITLDTYSHVDLDMQAVAAAQISALVNVGLQ
jgi:hypothetical protein